MDGNYVWFKRITNYVWFLMIGFSMNARSEESWKEQVLLHDGSKIIVTRSHSRGGRGEIGQSPIKEQAITFTVPGSNKTVIWKDEYSEDVGHANFNLVALHILNGAAYITTTAYGCLAFNKWGRPNPPYIFFKYDGIAWQRISLSKFPELFKEINLVINSSAHEKKLVEETRQSGFVSAGSIKNFNSSTTQKEYQAIVREPVKHEGPEACTVLVRVEGGWDSPGGAKAPMPNSPPSSNEKK